MLSSQHALFDIPSDVCYLNGASYSPLPRKTLEAGRNAVARKGRPWPLDNEFAAQQYDRTRKAAAALINAAPEDVALISSIGYGVSNAAKIFAAPIATLTARLAEGLRGSADPRMRAPHILSLAFPEGMPHGLVAQLAAMNVFVAPRPGRLRISPHVYNDEADVDRFVDVFCKYVSTAS
jgi:selenocysteine lyase/cysteine desulfurase